MRQTTILNGDWKFYRGAAPDADFRGYDDRAWRTVTLPHDWAVEAPFSKEYASGTGYLPGGEGWYRKHLTLPDDIVGKCVLLLFGGVYNNSQVWCNSNYLGKRPYGYSSFVYDISSFVQPGDNVISVRVNHEHVADSRWYTGSGIYRDVTLIVTDPVHFAPWSLYVTTPEVSAAQARVKVAWQVTGRDGQPAEVRCVLRDAAGTTVATAQADAAAGETAFTVAAPRRWSVDDPYLYTLCAQVWADGRLCDEETVRIGIRSFVFDADTGFTLNDVSMKLKGVCLHHDAGCLGAAVPARVWRYRLLKLQEMGCNAIRTSHNPPDPAFLDLCDELGFLVMDEAFDEWEGCKNKWWQGHNVNPPKHFGYAEDFPAWHERDLADMVRRDRNHPCVVMWSIGNEIDYPHDPYDHPGFERMVGNNDANKDEWSWRYDPNRPHADRLGVVAQELAAIVKQHDTTRPVTAALAYPALANCVGYADALDIVGYNYKESLYDRDHARYPGRVLYGSENHPYAEPWLAVRDKDYICGQFLWTGIDYLGEATGWPLRCHTSGCLTTAGFETDWYYQRRCLWSDAPYAALTVAPAAARQEHPPAFDAHPQWQGTPGEVLSVACYTNLDSVTLTLNGQVLETRARRDEDLCCLLFEVPYAPGTLRAVASTGDTVREVVLTTPGVPAQLRLTADADSLRADGVDTAPLVVEVLDAAGVPVAAAVPVTVAVTGGTLAGLENGAPDDLTPYTASTRVTREARLMAYVRMPAAPGTVTVTVLAPDVPAAVLTLTAE